MIEQKTKSSLDINGLIALGKVKRLNRPVDKETPSQEMTKLIAKGGSITFAGQAIRRIVNFVFQIMLTRILGVSAYGIYTLGYSMMGITGNLSMLGMQNAAVRFGSIYQAKADTKRLKGCFLLVLFSTTIVTLLAAILLFSFSNFIATNFFNKPKLTVVLKGFALAVPFFTLLTVSASLLRGLKNIKYSTGISEVFPYISNLFIVGIAFLLGFRLMGAVYGFAISSVLAAGLGVFLLCRILPELVSNIKPIYEPRNIFSYSLMVFLAGFSYLLLSRTDRIMLGYFTTAENVGVYSVAALIATQLSIFLNSLNGIFSPVIADLHSRDQMEQLNSLMKVAAKWTISLTLPVFMIIVLFPGIIQLFGPKFAVGWPALVVLAVAQLLHISTGSAQAVLIMCGRQKLELYNGIIMASLNIVLNILLIPKYGILGAAIATGISIVLVNLTRLVEVYIYFKIHPYKNSFWKPMASGIIAGGLWWGINVITPFKGYAWIGGIGIFLVLYFVALWSLGLDEEDKIVLGALKRRLLQC